MAKCNDIIYSYLFLYGVVIKSLLRIFQKKTALMLVKVQESVV